MQISTVIKKMNNFYSGIDWDGNKIDVNNTRDKYLFGDPNQECTGIVTTCFASYEVIRKAIDLGANLIICHEALFWNHGDKTEWLKDNAVYQKKKNLLEQNNLVVWRNHDYIHSGFETNEGIRDGIFYGIMKKLEWEDYKVGDSSLPMDYVLPALPAHEVAMHLMDKLNINGLRLIGDPSTIINRIHFPLHVVGNDNSLIDYIDKEKIDAVVAMEIVDFTLSEYVRDAYYSGTPKVIFSVGHFNLEEVGMEYMLQYLPSIVGEIPCHFVQSGDTFNYCIKEF